MTLLDVLENLSTDEAISLYNNKLNFVEDRWCGPDKNYPFPFSLELFDAKLVKMKLNREQFCDRGLSRGFRPQYSYWERDFVAVLFSTGKTENPDPLRN